MNALVGQLIACAHLLSRTPDSQLNHHIAAVPWIPGSWAIVGELDSHRRIGRVTMTELFLGKLKHLPQSGRQSPGPSRIVRKASGEKETVCDFHGCVGLMTGTIPRAIELQIAVCGGLLHSPSEMTSLLFPRRPRRDCTTSLPAVTSTCSTTVGHAVCSPHPCHSLLNIFLASSHPAHKFQSLITHHSSLITHHSSLNSELRTLNSETRNPKPAAPPHPPWHATAKSLVSHAPSATS
jgi:hypothetical protein